MTIITDFASLTDFMQEVVDQVPDIRTLIVISDGEDGLEELQNFFSQDYEGGLVAVLQIPQIDRSGDNQLGFMCSLMVLKKLEDQSFTEKINARNDTMKAILQTIGQLETASDESIHAVELPTAYTVELNVDHNSLFAVGRIVNAYIRGWYVDFDLVIPANHLLYPS